MTPPRYITAIIGGAALGYFIISQLLTGGYYLAALGIGILALFLNLLLNIASTRTIIEKTEATREETPKVPEEPKVLYKRKLGTIKNATIEISKSTGNPYINLIIKTPPFSIGDRTIDKLFKPIALVPQDNWLYENLKEATGIEPEFLSEKDTLEEGQIVTNLIDIPILFELLEQKYAGRMRLRVGTLYKAHRKK